MFAKFSTFLALFAIAAQVAVAAPPACLIAAINTQSDPSNVKNVCTSGLQQVNKYMSSNCGSNLNAATSAFASVCKDAGVTVSASPSSTGSSSSASTSNGSSSASITSGTNSASGSMPSGTGGTTGFATQTNANGGSSSAPSGSASGVASQPTPSSPSSSTNGAERLGMDILGLAALGVFGAMVAM